MLPWQVGCEFISSCRKIRAFVTENDAWNHLEVMRKAADLVALPEIADWQKARKLQRSDLLSFWDALLVAVCLRYDVINLYTEDMRSSRIIRGLRLINPFA